MVKTAQGMEDPDDDDTVDCPECGAEVYKIAGSCPNCGYWFSDKDHRAGGGRRGKKRSVADTLNRNRLLKIFGLVILAVVAVIVFIAIAASFVAHGD
jgi:uncharacterized membrane protein YvbJ